MCGWVDYKIKDYLYDEKRYGCGKDDGNIYMCDEYV
jgi:hypothetical protein